MRVVWPFDTLTPRKYRVVVIDPPWKMSMGTKSRPQHYPRMTDAELIELAESIRLLAHPEGCAFFVWFTSPMLVRALRIVMQGWRLRYSARAFVWIKTKGDAGALFVAPASLHVSTGYTTRKNAEDCYLFKLGRPRRLARNVREVIFAPLREHSRKPDETFERIEQLFAGPYCELFSRQTRPGWDTWGRDRGMFDGVQEEAQRQPSGSHAPAGERRAPRAGSRGADPAVSV